MGTFGKVMLGIISVILLTVIFFGMRSCGVFSDLAVKSMENSVVSYDEYQDIYNTCIQLNNDLGVIKGTPDNDPQFEQFSKSQRINSIKLNLNRWIGEYNAKSRHIDKKLWKSKDLPYELTTNQFSNY